MTIKEFFELFWLNLVVQKRNFVEYCRVVWRYYSNFSYAKLDLTLLLHSLFHNPFRISKDFWKSKGTKNIYVYGETPLTTLETIAKICQLNANDIIYELGCGRGRTCFWMYYFIGCRVVGIDIIPEFIKEAVSITNRFKLSPNVSFSCSDFFLIDLSSANVIYLYGTTMEDDQIKELVKKFERLPIGTKIISVSFPLTDYTENATFEVMQCFPVNFNWGEADVYLQYRK